MQILATISVLSLAVSGAFKWSPQTAAQNSSAMAPVSISAADTVEAEERVAF